MTQTLPQRMTIPLTVLLIGMGLWMFMYLAAWWSRGGQSAPLYSVRRYDPYGTAALYDLLRERHMKVATLEHPRLEDGQAGVLIQVLPLQKLGRFQTPPPQVQPRALREWIAEGNTVIQFTAGPTPLMAECGVISAVAAAPVVTPTLPQVLPAEAMPENIWLKIEEQMDRGTSPDDLPGWPVDATWQADAWSALNPRAPLPAPLSLVEPMGLPAATGIWHPLAIADDRVVAGICTIGSGRLIVVASPTPALNGDIALGGNLDFILAAVGDRPVWIDEWSHGIGAGGTVMNLIWKAGLMPVLVQLLFMIALYAWSNLGQRLREADAPPRARAAHEQIATLGHMYSQVLTARELRRRVHDEVHRRVARALRCPPSLIEQRLETFANKAAVAQAKLLLHDAPLIHSNVIPKCRRCQYDLRGSTSETCPECGAPIDAVLRAVIQAADLHTAGEIDQPPKSIHREMAQLLTRSHQFLMEYSRERSATRRA